jgi:D-3-phosphoglycerate dehydrogenase
LELNEVTIKVLVSDPIFEEGIRLLEDKGYQVTKGWNLPKADLPKIISEYDALIVRSATKVDSDILKSAARLKVIGRAGDGLDNVDQKLATEKGISIVNTPHVASESVAELTIGYIIVLARNIVEGTVSLREGKWTKEELMGTEVSGKTLGIIGCGSIGREVKKLASCLNLKVLTVDVCVSKEFIPIDEMLPKADIISIHVPLKGVMLVNCSRGGIVDEEALYDALLRGKVKAAALDVFEQEPPKNNKLLTLRNVYATPHIGAQTYEAQLRTSVGIAQKVIEFLEIELSKNG